MVSYREKLGWGEQDKLRMVRILWTGKGLDKISSRSELRVNASVSTLNWVNGPLSPGSEGP